MADIEIMELRAFEPRCLDCGETGPIETSVFFAMAWEESHVCVAARLGGDTARAETSRAQTARAQTARMDAAELAAAS